MVFKHSAELCDKVGEHSQGECGARDGALAEGGGPGKGGSLGHVRESEVDLFFSLVS